MNSDLAYLLLHFANSITYSPLPANRSLTVTAQFATYSTYETYATNATCLTHTADATCATNATYATYATYVTYATYATYTASSRAATVRERSPGIRVAP